MIIFIRAHYNQNAYLYMYAYIRHPKVFTSFPYTPIAISVHHSLINTFLLVTPRNDSEIIISVSSEQITYLSQIWCAIITAQESSHPLSRSTFKHIVCHQNIGPPHNTKPFQWCNLVNTLNSEIMYIMHNLNKKGFFHIFGKKDEFSMHN